MNTQNPGLHAPCPFPSTRGVMKLAFRGYLYTKEKEYKNGNIGYRCYFPNRECKGIITTNSNGKLQKNNLITYMLLIKL